jgi:DNA excision repair protein ERCC-2
LTQAKHPNRKELLKGLFYLLDFRRITRLVNDTYHLIHDGTSQTLKLACLNAKEHLQESINALRGTILFSATLDPLPYFQAFLTGDTGKVLRVDSPFTSSQVFMGVMTGIDVRYQTRAQSIDPISSVIHALQQTGKNTIVFAPSYSFIAQLKPHLPAHAIVQTKDLSLEERDQIIQRFKEEQGLLGVFVVGGVFAEGVDYLGSMLEQVLIIGVGMPGIDLETNLTKDLFDQQGANGFDYAYKYPGVSKIIQAAGRLLRSETDRGVLLFIDTRYEHAFYQSMMPSFYGSLRPIQDVSELQGHLNHFWAKK